MNYHRRKKKTRELFTDRNLNQIGLDWKFQACLIGYLIEAKNRFYKQICNISHASKAGAEIFPCSLSRDKIESHNKKCAQSHLGKFVGYPAGKFWTPAGFQIINQRKCYGYNQGIESKV